jgi:hypothetical protein
MLPVKFRAAETFISLFPSGDEMTHFDFEDLAAGLGVELTFGLGLGEALSLGEDDAVGEGEGHSVLHGATKQ